MSYVVITLTEQLYVIVRTLLLDSAISDFLFTLLFGLRL